MPTKRPGYNLSRPEIAPKSRVLHTRGGKFGPNMRPKKITTMVSTLPAMRYISVHGGQYVASVGCYENTVHTLERVNKTQ